MPGGIEKTPAGAKPPRIGFLRVLDATALLLVAAGVFAVVVKLGARTGFDAQGILEAGGLLLAGTAALALLFGPSRLLLSLFLVLLFTGHEFLSPLTFPLAGVEWHPRELMLFLLIAHLVVKGLRWKLTFRDSPVHYCIGCYALVYVLSAAVGVFHQYGIHEIIEECRYPVFLAAYAAFVLCATTRADLRFYSRLVLILATATALAGCIFFLYSLVSGEVINVQNVMGSYVKRQIGPFLLQSVRPNGHLYFEVAVVVLASLLLCPAVSRRRKTGYLVLTMLFLCAIAITMMRTAYIALSLSLILLAYWSLPKALARALAFAGLVGACCGAVVFGLIVYESVVGWLPGVGVSLKGRFVEIEGAWRAFLTHPLLGCGMGESFEGMGFVAKTSRLSYTRATYQTLHNVWMYFLFKGGLTGFGLAAVGLGGLVLYGKGLTGRVRAIEDRYFLRGLVAALAGQCIASLAMPRLTFPAGHVFIAMMASAFVILAAAKGQEPHGLRAGAVRAGQG